PGASAARHEQAEPREPGWCQQEQPIRCTRRVFVPAQRPLARGGHARRPQVSRRLLRRSQRSRRSRSGTTQPAVHAQRQSEKLVCRLLLEKKNRKRSRSRINAECWSRSSKRPASPPG